MTWHQMHIRRLSFPDASFEVILVKATLGAILLEEKPQWQISPQTGCFIHQTPTEVSWCLKPEGRFISITLISPSIRKCLCARREYDWSIRTHTYGDEFNYFVYVMTKGEEFSPEDAALEKKLLQAYESSTAPLVTTDTDTEEEFLSNMKL